MNDKGSADTSHGPQPFKPPFEILGVRVSRQAFERFDFGAQIDPMIARGRQSHYPPLSERFAKAPPAPENPTPLEAMSHRLQTPAGQKLYALRKQTPEPVFGIIKSVMGFRQFLLRGLDNVQGEWSLVTMAWNMKRMYALAAA